MPPPPIFRSLLAALCVLLAAPGATAGPTRSLKGYVESDLRLAFPGRAPQGADDEARFIRADNTARVTGRLGWQSAEAIADVSLIWRGLTPPLKLDDTIFRTRTDPVHFESDALFVAFYDVLLPGLDLHLGRQILEWGTGDAFNPTSVVNPLDLEDRIEFGDRVPNEMAVVRYTVPITIEGEDVTIFDELTFELVAVPTFRPGQIPTSALLPFGDPDLFVQFVSSPTLRDFAGLQRKFVERGGVFSYDVSVETPAPVLSNLQLGGRVSWTLYGVDMSVMGYRGFSDTLQPIRVEADLPATFPVDLNDLGSLTGLLNNVDAAGLSIPTRVVLGYPEIRVFGGDFTTSLDFLGGLGLWAEYALISHDALPFTLSAGDATLRETNVPSGSFWKLTAGVDYTFTSWWYANVQLLHGFPDEFGSDRIRDYIVGGSDFKMLDEQLILRLFGIVQIQDLSWVGYAQIMMRFWPGAEMILGAFVLEGEPDSKFGNVATGPNVVFLKGRYSF